jgi:hypothetical protein
MTQNHSLDTFVHAVREIRAGGGDMSDCAAELVALAGSDGVPAFLNGELADVAAGRFPSLTASSDGGKFLLTQIDDLALGLHVVRQCEPPRRVYGSPTTRLVTPAGPRSVDFSLWTQDRPQPVDRLERDRVLRGPRSGSLSPGQTLMLLAAQDIAHLSSDAPTPLLVLQSDFIHPLIWEYDAETGRPERLIAATPNSSRLEYTALLLADMGYEPAVPQLVRLAQHPDHAVRWSAIRAASHLDRAAGRDLLTRATSDVHPQIRRAAQRILDTQPS